MYKGGRGKKVVLSEGPTKQHEDEAAQEAMHPNRKSQRLRLRVTLALASRSKCKRQDRTAKGKTLGTYRL